jgi:mono/diheme cytochrome c family protein
VAVRVPILLPVFFAAAGLAAQVPAKSADELRLFFQQNCVKCHGVDGAAQGADGKKLKGFDFTNAAKMANQTDAELARTIRKGILFGWVMPSFKEQLSEQDADQMVKEILRKAQKGKAIAP